ncbi:hypothetical protein H0H87_010054 [Tephrocybe sp. NHM501043]|nr:hypothetical protein H0H87_010054 [Tephrocybe sp. NHM501043]
MPNLHTITLSDVSIGARLLKTIGKVKSLRALNLENSRFTEDTTKISVTTPSLTSLNLNYDPVDDHQCVPSTLVVNATDLKKLSARSLNLVLEILPQATTLVELSLKTFNASKSGWDAIGSLKSLKALEISDYSEDLMERGPLRLSPTCLPNLRRLHGPSSFSYIVAKRPIVSLDLTGIAKRWDGPLVITPLLEGLPATSAYFDHITQSSADIINLSISLAMYSIGPLCEKFPLVTSLRIRDNRQNLPDPGNWTLKDDDDIGHFVSVSCL